MTLIGYARVSTKDQSEDSQVDELLAAGCDPDRLFIDQGVSGKLASRPQFDACLKYLREGDTLVITRLSRAMRSIRDLLNTTHELQERGIDLRVLKQSLDTATPNGRLIFHIFAAIDEWQRELIVEGTKEGLAAARARGRVGGSKPKLDRFQRKRARELYEMKGPDGKRAHTVAEIGAILGVSRQTIYRALEPTASGA